MLANRLRHLSSYRYPNDRIYHFSTYKTSDLAIRGSRAPKPPQSPAACRSYPLSQAVCPHRCRLRVSGGRLRPGVPQPAAPQRAPLLAPRRDAVSRVRRAALLKVQAAQPPAPARRGRRRLARLLRRDRGGLRRDGVEGGSAADEAGRRRSEAGP